MVIALISTISIGMLFFVSGLAKVFYLDKSSAFLVGLDILPKNVSIAIGYIFPFLELVVGVGLILQGNNIFVNIVAFGVITVFLLTHFRAIIQNNLQDCFCFGKLLTEKLGFGGVIQCSLMILAILPNIFFDGMSLLSFYQSNNITLFIVTLIVASFFAITLILVRHVNEKFY